MQAIRGNEKREFSDSIWKMMPVHKYGWRASADVPEAVKQKVLEVTETPDSYAEKIKEAKEAVKHASEAYAKAVDGGNPKRIQAAKDRKQQAEHELKEILNAKASQ